MSHILAAPFNPRRLFLVDLVLPWLTVIALGRFFGLDTVPALAVAAVFPAASLALTWRRARRIEWIGLAVLCTIGFGLAMALLTHQTGLATIRAAPLFGLFGLVALVSLGHRTPLMFYVARAVAAGGDKLQSDAFTARLAQPLFRAAMRRLTLVWGLAGLGESALGISAGLLLPPHLALAVEPLLALATIGGLLAWTTRNRPAPAGA